MGGDKLGFARGKKARRPAQSEPAFFILGFIFWLFIFLRMRWVAKPGI